MQRIRTIIFDLGAVIINLKSEMEWFEEDLLPNFDNEKLLLLRQNNFFNDIETAKITVPDFISQLKEIAVDESITTEKINQYWNGIFKDIPPYRVDILKQLAKKYKLLLLSNTNHIHLDFIRKYMHEEFREDILGKIFDYCYYSQEIGMRKPDKAIYEYVMQHQNLTPETILFLDDKAENLEEPQQLGWQTFQVNFNKLSINDLQHLL